MNWEQLEGQWLQFAGRAKARWGKLTDDDLTTVSGKKDQLIGMVRERYGIAKEDAEQQVDRWLSKCKPMDDSKSASTPSKSAP